VHRRRAAHVPLLFTHLTRSDASEHDHTIFVSDQAGKRVLHPADRDCQASMVSPSGALLAMACIDDVFVKRIDDGSIAAIFDGVDVLGFAPGDVGLVFYRRTTTPSRYEVWYGLFGGTARLVGVAGYHQGGGDVPDFVSWPPFSYVR
jgi:hypothetical protein